MPEVYAEPRARRRELRPASPRGAKCHDKDSFCNNTQPAPLLETLSCLEESWCCNISSSRGILPSLRKLLNTRQCHASSASCPLSPKCCNDLFYFATEYPPFQDDPLLDVTDDVDLETKTRGSATETVDVCDQGRVAPGPTVREVTDPTSFRDGREGDVMIPTWSITTTTGKLMKTTGMSRFPPSLGTGEGIPGTKRTVPEGRRPRRLWKVSETRARVSGSSVPKPSSMNRLSRAASPPRTMARVEDLMQAAQAKRAAISVIGRNIRRLPAWSFRKR
jgi:hypothetical protein